jgi:lipid-A-disaccharide synthase
VKSLRAYVRKLFVILPFEVEWFRKHQMEVAYFGNPLVDEVSAFLDTFAGAEEWRKSHDMDERPVVALLAGSRRKEIEGMLPAMLETARRRKDHQFVVAAAPGMEPDFYEPFLKGQAVKCVFGETYDLLASASAAMVTSGTATLETALFRVPQVVMYRTSAVAFSLARVLVKVKHISLVNLILGRALVREVIQRSLAGKAGEELSRILDDKAYRDRILDGYGELGGKIGERGVSARIAGKMVEMLKEEQ